MRWSYSVRTQLDVFSELQAGDVWASWRPSTFPDELLSGRLSLRGPGRFRIRAWHLASPPIEYPDVRSTGKRREMALFSWRREEQRTAASNLCCHPIMFRTPLRLSD